MLQFRVFPPLKYNETLRGDNLNKLCFCLPPILTVGKNATDNVNLFIYEMTIDTSQFSGVLTVNAYFVL